MAFVRIRDDFPPIFRIIRSKIFNVRYVFAYVVWFLPYTISAYFFQLHFLPQDIPSIGRYWGYLAVTLILYSTAFTTFFRWTTAAQTEFEITKYVRVGWIELLLAAVLLMSTFGVQRFQGYFFGATLFHVGTSALYALVYAFFVGYVLNFASYILLIQIVAPHLGTSQATKSIWYHSPIILFWGLLWLAIYIVFYVYNLIVLPDFQGNTIPDTPELRSGLVNVMLVASAINYLSVLVSKAMVIHIGRHFPERENIGHSDKKK